MNNNLMNNTYNKQLQVVWEGTSHLRGTAGHGSWSAPVYILHQIQLFVDDCLTYRPIIDLNDIQTLQDLNLLHSTWAYMYIHVHCTTFEIDIPLAPIPDLQYI